MLTRGYFRWFLVSWLLCLMLSSTSPQHPPVRAASLVPSRATVISLPPSEIILRAREWVTANVPYSRSVDPSDRFHNYRADCSGLVTMAWGIPETPPNYGLFTGDNPNNPDELNSLSSVADELGKALDATGKPILSTMMRLQPGDILLNQVGDHAHVILFVGWIDIVAKKVVSTPTVNKDNGNYYYDGIEENGDVGAIEHTPDHSLHSNPFDYRQPWPYPYYPGYGSEDYYAWRFDAAKASKLGYATIKPSGDWMPPSPKDGDIVTNANLHLAATAYPIQKGDPAIAMVYFTLRINGTWTVVCSPSKPSKNGHVYTCDINLKKLGLSYGQTQVSFNVVDNEGNINLAPQGVHTLMYASAVTIPMPPTQTNCPATGTARVANTAPLAFGTHQNIVYLYNKGDYNSPTSSTLNRYYLTTGQTIGVVTLAHKRISLAQISIDGQWILFVSQGSGSAALQLIRMDGQGLQTLYCTQPSESISSIQWSPDQNSVVFEVARTLTPYSTGTVYMMSITTGKLQVELLQPHSPNQANIAGYQIHGWLDNTRVYMVGITAPAFSNSPHYRNIYILDTAKGSNQQGSDLQKIMTVGDVFQYVWDFDRSFNGTQLFVSQCKGCGTGGFVGGPSSITVQPATGGLEHIIYSSQTLSIAAVKVISNGGLLLNIHNDGGDTSRNGWWKINTDGSSLTRLTTEGASGLSFYTDISVSRDGSMYAYKLDDLSGETVFLNFGSLSGSAPTSFATLSQGNILNAVSLNLVIVGWTTM